MSILAFLISFSAAAIPLINPAYLNNARIVGIRCEVRPSADTGVVTLQLEDTWYGRHQFRDVRVPMDVCPDLYRVVAPAVACYGSIHADLLTSALPGGESIVKFWNVQNIGEGCQ